MHEGYFEVASRTKSDRRRAPSASEEEIDDGHSQDHSCALPSLGMSFVCLMAASIRATVRGAARSALIALFVILAVLRHPMRDNDCKISGANRLDELQKNW